MMIIYFFIVTCIRLRCVVEFLWPEEASTSMYFVYAAILHASNILHVSCQRLGVWESVVHLGDGSGAAPPGVQHHCVLMSFLQHLVLQDQRNHSLRTRLVLHQQREQHSSYFSSPFFSSLHSSIPSFFFNSSPFYSSFFLFFIFLHRFFLLFLLLLCHPFFLLLLFQQNSFSPAPPLGQKGKAHMLSVFLL